MTPALHATYDYVRRNTRSVTGPGGYGVSRTTLLVVSIWWIWMPICYQLYKLFINSTGFGVSRQELWLFAQQNIWAADAGAWGLSPWAWIWLIVGLIGTIVIIMADFDEDGLSYTETGVVIVSAIAILACSIPAVKGIWDADKDEAKFFLSATTFYVKDPSLKGQHPSSLQLLYEQTFGNTSAPFVKKEEGSGDNIRVRIGPVVLKKGDLPSEAWDFVLRSSSYDGAKHSLDMKTSVGTQVDPWDSSVTYVYGNPSDGPLNTSVKHPQDNRWAAVIDVADPDAKNYRNPTAGVAEWQGGMSTAHTCLFGSGDNKNYKLNRAFGGNHLNSLPNLIKMEFPTLSWVDEDVAGFCDAGNRPVIVISVTKTIGWRAGTQQVPAGIIVVRGTPSGFPTTNNGGLEYKPVVKPGEFPVPVYPISVARKQREALNWAAGRGNLKNIDWGYEPSIFATQAGNTGEYVMLNETTGVIEAWTPQRPRKGKSQKLVNWNRVRMDQVTDGQLNPLDAFILEDNDPRAYDPGTLDSAAQQYVKTSGIAPDFFTNGGRLKEFLPTSTGRFRGFGEDKNGNTVLYIDISADCRAMPRVVTLDANSGAEITRRDIPINVDPKGCANLGNTQSSQPPAVGAPINADMNQCRSIQGPNATLEQLVACKSAIENEMIRRLQTQQAGQPTPSPTAVPAPTGSVPATPTPSAVPSPAG